ncbi:MAG: hypothetical protein CL891_00645 [Dehalococcoidia bacterium]|nr:hypothetical protein [Dehalococcoidia bacterium]
MQQPLDKDRFANADEHPAKLQDSLKESRQILQVIFDQNELALWENEAMAMANHSTRSWEATVEFASSSTQVAKHLSFSSFLQWARSGSYLTKDSATLGAAYFKVGPEAVKHIQPNNLSRWAALGRSLYKGTWKSSTLSVSFFDLSPSLLKALPFPDLETFTNLIESLSARSYDLAGECLIIGNGVLGSMGRERSSFLILWQTLSENSWRDIKGVLETYESSVSGITEPLRNRFLSLANILAMHGAKDTPRFLAQGGSAIGTLKTVEQEHVLDLCERLLKHSPISVAAFLNNLTLVINKVSMPQLDFWFDHGIGILSENPEGGLAYFKLESKTSEQMLEGLSSSTALEGITHLLHLYCSALSGSDIEIKESSNLAEKGLGWVSADIATTEGKNVYLPAIVDIFPTKKGNFDWYKVVSTHQTARLEFGSFDFSYDRPSTQFNDLRAPRGLPSSSFAVVEEEQWITEIGHYFSQFDNRRIALDLFTTFEDTRLGFLIKYEYPGIKSSYASIQKHAVSLRPETKTLPLQQAIMEILVQFSLDEYTNLLVPRKYSKAIRVLAKLQRCLLDPIAKIEDTAESALRAYKIIAKIPNEPDDDWKEEDFDSDDQFSDDELSEIIKELDDMNSEDSAHDIEYGSPEAVDFRGDFKPELVQTLNKLRDGTGMSGDGDQQELDQDKLEQLLKDNPEMSEGDNKDMDFAALFAQNMLRQAGLTQATSNAGQGFGAMQHVEESGGELDAKEPKTYVYNEWDFRAGDYKPKWCVVREKTVEQGESTFFNETTQKYASLLQDVRRQFELVMPEGFRKLRRQPDGDDFDFDAATEAMIDRRSGITPSEKVYWFRNKQERDVSVVFLLDMSASTAEAIDEGKPINNATDAPEDPIEYMVWLRSRREGLVRRQYKRIIDLEKEGVALLMQALESIGDIYGIYGFSGYGRENVEFYVIKDIEESLTDGVKKRIDKISPLHATRMGPAIRHATTKLSRQETKTKILFLISDGRPQDRGYSREGVEKEYAVHDTHMALVEARRLGIIPFCLTVDKTGHDYLKTMCGDMEYEVLDEISMLPNRLPHLYRKLTI